LTSTMDSLAVVIPAYKDLYLEETLESFRNQSDKNFTVYVGDDNSPFDIARIVRLFRKDLNIRYTKFNENIGAKSLVAQWERCIGLINGEDWIWVFGDDDVADKYCVSAFRSALASTASPYDIYSFNTTVINERGDVLSAPPPIPLSETAVEYAYHLLLSKRANCMSDHIFSAKVYKKKGGFIHTDFAQAADWLNAIYFANDRGIRLIDDAPVRWRYSGSNISSLAYMKKTQTIRGHLQFIRWIMENFKYLANAASTKTYEDISQAALYNLKFVLTTHYRGINLASILPVLLFIKREFNKSALTSLKIVREINAGAVRA